MLSRINKARKILAERNIDAFFVTNQFNVAFLTSFKGLSPHGREAFFLVTRKNAYLFTFPTCFGLYKKGGNGFKCLNVTLEKKLHEHLNDISKKEKIQKIAFEKDNLTLSELDSLKKKLQINLLGLHNAITNLRLVKDNQEIEKIQKACHVVDRAFKYILKNIKRRMSEKDISLKLEFFIKKHADDVAFPPIVAFSKNAAIPHYLPSGKKKLNGNALILMDFGAKVNGYCSDMTRVIFFGLPKKRIVKAYEVVVSAQKLALEKLKAGVNGARIDKITKKYIEKNGFAPYSHGLGHGVGLEIHEEPRLRINLKQKLLKNMVFSIEPGIYVENEFGIRIEDLVVLKKDGAKLLTKSSKKMIVI